MSNTRIELTDTIPDIIEKMSEGNIGAMSVCMKLMEDGAKIDPQAFMGGVGILLSLDALGIYGSRIWMLYKYVCGQSPPKMVGVLRAHQLGFISKFDLTYSIDNPQSIDVDSLCEKVVEELGVFNLDIWSI